MGGTSRSKGPVAALGLLLAAQLGAPGRAQAAADPVPQERPRIGLVLSGGGARGAAHAGVLEVLEELRIPIDFVSGTSMGAIVGGLYASGLAPEEIEQALVEVDWESALSDASPRSLMPFRRKRDDLRFLIDFELGFRPWRFLLPKGLLQGQRLGLILETMTLHASHIDDFDELPIPFRAVAADIETGEAVVMGSGQLATAMRASMSVPGVFAPVRRDSRTLVDGGIAQNLPVSVALEMGADVIIAIDISEPLLPGDEISSLLGVTGQVVTILMLTSSYQQRSLLDDDDVLLEPHLADLGSTEFHRAADAIAVGREAAREASDRLARFAVDEDTFASHLERIRAPGYEPPLVREIRIENDSRLSDNAIRVQLTAKEGQPLDNEQLLEDIARIYGYEAFERVDFRLEDVEDGEADLVVALEEKSWGPSYVQFALNVEHDFEGSNAFGIGVSNIWYPINSLGAEWRNIVEVGSTTRVFSEFFQPLDERGRWFVAPTFEFLRQDIDLFVQGNRLAEFEVSSLSYSGAFGRILSNWGEIRAGVRFANGELDRITGDPSLTGGDFEEGAAFLRLTGDTLDDANFPKSGAIASVEYQAFRDSLGSVADFDTLSVTVGGAQSWAPDTLFAGVSYATVLEENLPIQNSFAVGGFLNLSGLNRGELFGNHAGVARLVYYRELGYRKGVPFDVPFYAGLSAELGGAFDRSEDVTGRNALWAGSAFIAADTFLGPLFVGYGYAEGGRRAVYVFVGAF